MGAAVVREEGMNGDGETADPLITMTAAHRVRVGFSLSQNVSRLSLDVKFTHQ